MYEPDEDGDLYEFDDADKDEADNLEDRYAEREEMNHLLEDGVYPDPTHYEYTEDDDIRRG
jgi:hypothetical protein